MDFYKIDGLIVEEEDCELYKLQTEIINSAELTDNAKLLRIAIMQTNCPIDDWENGAEIIRLYCTDLHGKDLLVACHIAVTAYEFVRYEHINYFLSLLAEEEKNADNEFLSIAEYFKARYFKELGKSETDIIAALEESILLCPSYVMHYVFLAGYRTPDEKIELLNKALSNIQAVLSMEELRNLPESYFSEPDTVMETITQTVISESWYEHIKTLQTEINSDKLSK